MSCDRSRSLDLAAFLVEPSREEFASFREHYPVCAECSREVARWTRLESRLRAAGEMADPHPPASVLLALARHPERLSEDERSALGGHLEACPACRNELRALHRSVPSEAPGSRGAVSVARTPIRMPPPARRGSRIAVLAAAAALVVLASIAALLLREGALDEAAREPEPIARTGPPPGPRAPAGSEEPAPIAPDESSARDPALAESEPSRPPPAPNAEPDRRLATSEPPAAPPEPRPAPEQRSRATEPADPVRVAMILPEEPPVYVAPGPGDPELARLRRSTALRAGAAPMPRIQVLAPDHVGLTAEASPTLYWTLSRSTDLRVELVVTDERAEAPIVDQVLDGARAGTHALRLASLGVSLAPGVTYRWYATLVPDPEERTSEVVSGGAIRRVEPAPELARRLADAEPGRRAHVLAEAGLFYDALETVSRWTAEDPDRPEPPRYREALLRAVGVADATPAP